MSDRDSARFDGAPPPPDDPIPSSSFGKYRLLRELGRGGMGIVHEAVDTVLNRKVALKLLQRGRHADPAVAREEEERFIREAQLAANLEKHPNVVAVYEAGVLDGRPYLAMEFVAGRSMSDWRKEAMPPRRRQVEVLRDTALAVQHAHDGGIIHRDLKPANILVDGRERPLVTDFGLAKAIGPASTTSLTASDLVLGTPHYMSPEQAKASKDVDSRTDIYALGVMLYETLADRVPFSGGSVFEILMNATNQPLEPPSRVNRAEPADPEVERICLKAMARALDERYATARELAEDLSRWLGGPSKPAHRARSILPFVLAGAIAVFVGLLLKPGPPSPEPGPPIFSPAGERSGHERAINALLFLPDGRLLSGGADSQVLLWGPGSDGPPKAFGSHVGKVEALALSPEGRRIAVVTEMEDRESEPGDVSVWELETGALVRKLEGHGVGMNAAAFSPDGALLAAGGKDAAIRVWDLATGETRALLEGHGGWVRGVAFLPGGTTLVSASMDGDVRLWNWNEGTTEAVLKGNGSQIWSMGLSRDSRRLATARQDGSVALWDLSSRESIGVLPGHAKAAQAAAFSPDGRLVATGGRDHQVIVWDLATRAPVARLTEPTDSVWTTAFSLDGRVLASAGFDLVIRQWTVSNR